LKRQVRSANVDPATVEGFGLEWSAYDQAGLSGDEYRKLFDGYFGIFPFEELTADAEGFDLGCGSGRWAAGVAPRVGLLHCIDPSEQALGVARRLLSGHPNARFHHAAADTIPLADGSQDFGYSLGVLHHVPDTARALADCVRKLKPGAPFLVYLYYALDNRSLWFRALWRVTDLGRQAISRLPFGLRKAASTAIAATIYWPLARLAWLFERLGANVSPMPLSAYRYRSFYSMRTDALDRFGTRLEQRFTRPEIDRMMRAAGLSDIRFSRQEPYWVACGRRARGKPEDE
jgi:SAM-dependent methyltransferase